MPYSAEGYKQRAEECVRVANLAKDPMLQNAILRLRQDYLAISHRLDFQQAPDTHQDADKTLR